MKFLRSLRNVGDFLFRKSIFNLLVRVSFCSSTDCISIGMDESIFLTHLINSIPALDDFFPLIGNLTSDIIPIILFLYFFKKF